ncbi:MAG: DUF4166 domain-containing protein [Roseovarius indicus]
MSGDPFDAVIAARGLAVAPAVRAFHAGEGVHEGRAEITRGRHVLVRLGLWLAGMPPEGRDVPVRVRVTGDRAGSVWRRDFGGHVTVSRLRHDRSSGHVEERFGPVRLALSVTAEGGALVVGVAGMSVLGLPVPKGLRPVSGTREFEDEDGRFRFDVGARIPWLGPVIRYEGWLEPAPQARFSGSPAIPPRSSRSAGSPR